MDTLWEVLIDLLWDSSEEAASSKEMPIALRILAGIVLLVIYLGIIAVVGVVLVSGIIRKSWLIGLVGLAGLVFPV